MFAWLKFNLPNTPFEIYLAVFLRSYKDIYGLRNTKNLDILDKSS